MAIPSHMKPVLGPDQYPGDPRGRSIALNIKAGKLHYLTSRDKRYQYFAKDEKAIPEATDEKQETTNSED